MEAFWTYPFMQRALIAAILVSVVCSCLGVFVVLRKLTFLSDAVAHATFTGIALGLLIKADPLLTGMLFSVLGAISLIYLMEKTDLSLDTLIGVYFSAAVALGIVLLRFSPHYQSEVLERLFGSILGISWWDLAIHAALTVVVLATLFYHLKTFLKMAFHRDLAASEGINVRAYDYLFMMLLALTITISIEMIGVLLVSALVIIPAASSRLLFRSFGGVMAGAMAISLTSTLAGLLASFYVRIPDGPSLPSGPAIVLCTLVFFAASAVVHRKHR